ncbi:MAG: lysophospholipid acyltransferase family protein [Sedimentisphaerales bacterium]|nr:lysophospholipid acyltransferase family protein [Sedimentisphaerales bacterium]
MLKEKLKARWYWLARWICRVFCLLFFRVRTYGRDNIPRKGPFIIVSNHQSYLDPIFCGGLIKRHSSYMARDTLFTNWFFGPLISSVSAIPVKLGEPDISTMRKVIDKLKKGGGVTLFPEGTRTHDGKITPFKPGLGLLSRRGNAPIVPALIDGAFECWPRHKKLFTPGQIHITYGKRITVRQVKDMGDKKLAELLTQTLRKMQNQSRIKQNKKPYDY